MTVDPASLPNPWAQIAGRHIDGYVDHGLDQAVEDVGWLLSEVVRLRRIIAVHQRATEQPGLFPQFQKDEEVSEWLWREAQS